MSKPHAVGEREKFHSPELMGGTSVDYLGQFGLAKDPFEVEPDLDFYAENASRRRLRLRIQRGLTRAKGLTLLTGPEGTGKTLVARRILHDLDPERFEAIWMVVLPGTRGAESLLRRLATELGVVAPATERGALLAEIHGGLEAIRSKGRHAVLIFDNAQCFDREALALVSHLLALESDERRLLSLMLVGSPALLEMLSPDADLGHRVDVRGELAALEPGDVASYLEHRWESAGGAGAEVLSGFAPRLFSLSEGRLRRINTLMDNALFEASLEGRNRLESGDIEKAARLLGYEAAPGPIGSSAFSSGRLAPREADGGSSRTSLADESGVGASSDPLPWMEGGSAALSIEDNGVEMLLDDEDVLELGQPISGLSNEVFKG